MSLTRFIFSPCSVGVGIDSVSLVTLPGIKKPPASQAVAILNMFLIMKDWERARANPGPSALHQNTGPKLLDSHKAVKNTLPDCFSAFSLYLPDNRLSL